jgi:hypothetical protein
MDKWEIKTRKLITRMNRYMTERLLGKKERETEGRKKKNSVQIK